jgi:hypothetical protein
MVFGKLVEKNIIWRWPSVISHFVLSASIHSSDKGLRHTPFRLNSEEYPYPPSEYFKQFHQEYATFPVVEVIQVGTELEAPGASQEEIHDDYVVIHTVRMEKSISS